MLDAGGEICRNKSLADMSRDETQNEGERVLFRAETTYVSEVVHLRPS
jgi:hypothetical protein